MLRTTVGKFPRRGLDLLVREGHLAEHRHGIRTRNQLTGGKNVLLLQNELSVPL